MEEECLLFLGVAGLGLMTDGAHDVGLAIALIDSIAHGFAIDGKAFILTAISLVPTLQSAVEVCGVDTDKDVTDDR